MSQINNRSYSTAGTVNNQSCFRQVTQRYLDTFDCILNRMIEGMTWKKFFPTVEL